MSKLSDDGPSQGAKAISGGSAARKVTGVGAINHAGTPIGAKQGAERRSSLFDPSGPAQAGLVPRASAPSGTMQ
jgi:hypothetical protein